MTGASASNPQTLVRLIGVDYAEVTAPPMTNIAPVTIEYVLTDSDGQSDTAQLSIYTADNSITGTAGADNISGSAENDAIVGAAGDDILAGNAGHDTISGGDGADTISGGTGNDYLSGGADNDILKGDAGDDHLAGDAGNDILDGGLGNDIVLGGSGDDLVFGGAGNDQLEGGAGNDQLYGGSGADILLGGDGNDILVGGSDDDILTGGLGSDSFDFNLGDQGIIGAPAVDVITDFNADRGDVLDLSDLLQGEESNPLTDYLQFTLGDFDGDGALDDTRISIDHDGGALFEITQEITLHDVDLTGGGTLPDQDIINSLLSNNNLITD
jgi:Ca2+-binding RTX toxin-like protein